MVRLLFRGMGQELFVRSEAMINKATAVSGSGPGLLFLLVEGWLKAIQKLGFSLSESKELLFNTLEASNELLLINGDPSELKNQVASKGGTTEAGLKVMAKNGVERLWPKVLAAAYKRSQGVVKIGAFIAKDGKCELKYKIYPDYRKFLNVIEKAEIACKNSGKVIHNHFVHMDEMVLK